jgi:hypothetical protein
MIKFFKNLGNGAYIGMIIVYLSIMTLFFDYVISRDIFSTSAVVIFSWLAILLTVYTGKIFYNKYFKQ